MYDIPQPGDAWELHDGEVPVHDSLYDQEAQALTHAALDAVAQSARALCQAGYPRARFRRIAKEGQVEWSLTGDHWHVVHFI